MNTKAEKAARHVMMILADNTPHGPTEYAKCLKVITGAITSYFPEPSVPVSELLQMLDYCGWSLQEARDFNKGVENPDDRLLPMLAGLIDKAKKQA